MIDATGWTDAAMRGDTRALESCFDYLRPRLMRYLVRRCRSEEDAEGLVQSTFLATLSSLEKFRGECPFDRWVWRIAGHELIGYYRRLKRTASNISIDDPDSEFFENLQQPDSPSPLEETESRVWMTQMMEIAQTACTTEEWQVMLAFYRTESFDETAKLLKLNPATVRSHFLRGRSKLLSYLILERPELIGGREAVQAAISDALEDEGSGLTREQFDNLQGKDWSNPRMREASLAIARYLPSPFAS